MTNSNTGWGCRQISWLAAAIIGVVAAIILGVAAHWGWFLAILAGIVVAVFVGLILTYFFCGEAAAPASSASTSSTPAAAEAPAPVAAAPAEPAPTPTPTAAPAAASAAPAAPAAVIKPSKALAGEEELASQKGDWKYEAPAAEPAKPAKKPAAKPAAKAAPKAEKAAKPAAKPAAKTTKAKAAAAKAPAPAAEGGKPAALSAPRGGKADDLKVIEGIGPKLEEVVNSYGVYHYDQIAAWGADEVAWMDGNMPRFKGRVTRDKWVAQAKIIVEEGIEAFLERAKTNDY